MRSEARAFLTDPNNQRRYFVLECGEIYGMEDEPPGEQNTRLVEEIASLATVNTIPWPTRSIDALGLGNWSNVLYYDPAGLAEESPPGDSPAAHNRQAIPAVEEKASGGMPSTAGKNAKSGDLYERFPFLAPETPHGLPKRMHIRRFSPKLFNNSNGHNPLVAQTCTKCDGRGFYRVYDPPLGDRPCEQCKGVGALDIPERFFRRRCWWTRRVAPNAAGYVKCPSCGRLFPVFSDQFWTGLRHDCGQKLRLVGPNAEKCWTRQKG